MTMSKSLCRPRVRAKKNRPPLPNDPLAAEKILARLVSGHKEPQAPYYPIIYFDFYARNRLSVALKKYEIAKEKHKQAVQYLRGCRAQNQPDILDAINSLQRTMTDLECLSIEKEKKEIEEMRKLQEETEEEPVPAEQPPTLPGVNMNHVCVSLKVQKKTNSVKVKMSTPLLDLHEKYYKNLKRPPIAEKIRAYSKIGYPEWYLEKMLVSHESQVKKKPEIAKFVEMVFSKYDSKKQSTAKPKSFVGKLKNQ